MVRSICKRFVINFCKLLTIIFYKVKISGLNNIDHYNNRKKGLLIICNHLSYLEPPLISMFLPIWDLTFAINPHISVKWWVRPFLKIVPVISVDPNHASSLKILINYINLGKNIVIFPEGRTSTTGSLMKIYSGASLVAINSGADILPIHITGTEASFFSRLKNKISYKKTFLYHVINIYIGKIFNITENRVFNSRKELRNDFLVQMHRAMSQMVFLSFKKHGNIFSVLLEESLKYPTNQGILGDKDNLVSYQKLMTYSLCYCKFIFQFVRSKSNIVAILLDNSLELIYSIFAISLKGYRKFILNIANKSENVIGSLVNLQIKILVTSKKLLDFYSDLQNISDLALSKGITIVYVEDIILRKIDHILCLSKMFSGFNNLDNNTGFVFSNSQGGYEFFSDRQIQENIISVISNFNIRYSDIFLTNISCSQKDGVIWGLLPLLKRQVGYIIKDDDMSYKTISAFIYSKNITILFTQEKFFYISLKYIDFYELDQLRIVTLKYSSQYFHLQDFIYNNFKNLKLNIISYLLSDFTLIFALNNYTYSVESDFFHFLPFSNMNFFQEKQHMSEASYSFVKEIFLNEGWKNFNNKDYNLIKNFPDFTIFNNFFINNLRENFKKNYREDPLFKQIYFFFNRDAKSMFQISKNIDDRELVNYEIFLQKDVDIEFFRSEIEKFFLFFQNINNIVIDKNKNSLKIIQKFNSKIIEE
ncbi:MAG: 1-acyl-sn-glycerol-3-phosphate acyltransferase [Rickettsia sp.]|nr:1-acyl-sn-glycerol-3-phosphate acyltransferase [Rickettsia sp.]